MGPTKIVLKEDDIYEGKSGKLFRDMLSTLDALRDYAPHYYIALPMEHKGATLGLLNEKPVYCFRESRLETLDDEVVYLYRCTDWGGMGINIEGPAVERDCIQCTQCEKEFHAGLEIMES